MRNGKTRTVKKNTYETDVTSRDQKRSASNTDETEFPSEDKTNDETGNEGGNTLNNTAMENNKLAVHTIVKYDTYAPRVIPARPLIFWGLSLSMEVN